MDTPDEPRQKPIPRRLRFEILRRDNYTCRYCGASAPDATLTVDHVIPRALGGADDPTNLVTACRDCNSGKASTSPDEHIVADVDAAAMLWARAIDRVVEARRVELGAIDRACRDFYESWTGLYRYGTYDNLPGNWARSIETFMARGLNYDDLIRLHYSPAENSVQARNAWRYFCGCCWNEIGYREERARRLIEDGQV